MSCNYTISTLIGRGRASRKALVAKLQTDGVLSDTSPAGNRAIISPAMHVSFPIYVHDALLLIRPGQSEPFNRE